MIRCMYIACLVHSCVGTAATEFYSHSDDHKLPTMATHRDGKRRIDHPSGREFLPVSFRFPVECHSSSKEPYVRLWIY